MSQFIIFRLPCLDIFSSTISWFFLAVIFKKVWLFCPLCWCGSSARCSVCHVDAIRWFSFERMGQSVRKGVGQARMRKFWRGDHAMQRLATRVGNLARPSDCAGKTFEGGRISKCDAASSKSTPRLVRIGYGVHPSMFLSELRTSDKKHMSPLPQRRLRRVWQ